MKRPALVLAAALSIAGAAIAADNEAGVPLSPAEAVGGWTLESGGRSLCVIRLGQDKHGGAYVAEVPASCAGSLPDGVVGWAPAADGMSLTDAQGQSLMGFHRWSNSLFVSRRSSGEDIQLRRGGPQG